MTQQVLIEKNHTANLEEAAGTIMRAFSWQDTDEGDAYWADVYDNLMNKAAYGTVRGRPLEELVAERSDQDVRSVVTVDATHLNAVLAAVDAEPELPGPMPLPQFAYAAASTHNMAKVLREVVRLTKKGIRQRIEQLVADTDDPVRGSSPAADSDTAEASAEEQQSSAEEQQSPAEVVTDKWAAVWPRRWVMAKDGIEAPWKGPFRLFGVSEGQWRFKTHGGPFNYARPATAEEIATVEPPKPAKPEIGEAYREATFADMYRRDREYWGGGRWRLLTDPWYLPDTYYRVPVDHIPTDEDAKQRRTVLIPAGEDGGWMYASLRDVAPNTELPFFVVLGDGTRKSVEYARLPYPGE